MPSERDQERAAVLLAMYELGDGERRPQYPAEVAGLIGMDVEQAKRVMRYLAERHLVEAQSMAGDYQLTPAGVDRAEQLMDAGASVPKAPGLVLSIAERRSVEEFLTQYERAKGAGELDGLDPNDAAEVQADVDTLAAQNRSPKPKRKIVTLAITGLSAVLSGVAGNSAYAALVKLAQTVAGS